MQLHVPEKGAAWHEPSDNPDWAVIPSGLEQADFLCLSDSAGSMKAFFRGNGTNVIKIGPETALKLSLNDGIRNWVVSDPASIQLHERMISGALAGASAQVMMFIIGWCSEFL